MGTYGLTGEVLGHSFSPEIHAQFNIENYGLYEIPKEKIEDFFREAPFDGVNVTIPYKEIAMKHCVQHDEASKMIGALNTLVKTPEGLHGYNSDLSGFIAMCTYTGIDFTGKKVVILGSGGTSKTACYASKIMGAAKTSVISRKGTTYEIRYDHDVRFTTYEDSEILNEAQILINTTPVGMFPNNEEMPINLDLLPNLSGVVDVIYNPLETRLVLEAKKRNVPATNGLFMLIAQAYVAGKYFLHEWEEYKDLSKDDIEKIEAVYQELLRKKKNIVLTGMPGSGKSTIGKLYAQKYQKPFADTDEEFEKTFGISPKDCILNEGEEAFREKETQIAVAVSKLNGYVIATGGGIILKERNINVLKQNGDIVYLHRRLKDLATEGRPLSRGREKLKALYYKRLPIYLSKAKKVIRVEDDSRLTLENLERALADGDNNIKVLIINGPNLNMLGIREPDIYGAKTYDDLMNFVETKAKEMGVEVDFFQSNHEGDLVDAIQDSFGVYDGIVINPGAYTHTSVALLDAVKAVSVPTVEVHISDVDEREDFRKVSFIRKAAIGCIQGRGFDGYVDGISLILSKMEEN